MKQIAIILLFFPSLVYSQVWVSYQEAIQSQNFDKILQLDISGMQLKKIPDSVFLFKNLQSLNLSHNQIGVLSSKLKKLKKLEFIKLDYNGSELRSKEMILLEEETNRNYAVLDTQDQKFIKVRDAFNQFHREEDSLLANLTRKRYREMYDSITPINKKLWEIWTQASVKLMDSLNRQLEFPALKSLDKLYLGNNRMIHLHKSIRKLKNLTEIRLNDNQYQQFPNELLLCKKLRKVNLANNLIEVVSPDLGKLKEVDRIILYNNKLDSIPASIYKMAKLKELDIAYNTIVFVSAEIGNLEKLEFCYLSYNKIRSLPSEIGNLKNLKDLFVHHNSLTDIPDSIGALKNLRTLHIHNNLISEFPEQLLMLQNLEDLNISNNFIPRFSLKMAELPKLKLLIVYQDEMDKDSPDYLPFAEMFESLRNRNVIVRE